MKRFFSGMILAGLVLVPLAARAETDYVAMPVIRDIQNGAANANQIRQLRVSRGATIGGTAQVGRVSTTNVQLQAVAATTVAANDALAVSGAVMPLTSVTAVTGTLAAVASAQVGLVTVFENTGTNVITIADSAPAQLSGAIALGQYDTLTVLVRATNRIVQVSTSNN